MRTIAIVNQKGGSGKTTTAINLAAVFAGRGRRTLLIDIDPQGHCAVGLGVPESRVEHTVTDGLLAAEDEQFDTDDLLWEVSRNLHLIPATMRLAMLEAPGGGLHELPDKDRRLLKLTQRLGDRFDICLIDCPPTIGLLTFNALRACREALIPVETGFFAFRGSKKQWETITRLIAHINQPIACHILPTLHDPTSPLAGDILAALRREFAGQIVPVVIEEAESLREAASVGRAILEHAPTSRARRQFESLAQWLDDHAASPVGERGGRESEIETLSPTDAADPYNGGRAGELARRMSMAFSQRPPAEDDASKGSRSPSPAPAPASIAPVSEVGPTSDCVAPVLTPVRPLAPVEVELKARPVLDIDVSESAAIIIAKQKRSHLYGVRQISRGGLFIQPLDLGTRVFIAGDFNGWSATATMMQRNESAGVHQAIVPLQPGRYVYRLVVDGRWQADPHHALTQMNPHGEVNSVFMIKARSSATAGSTGERDVGEALPRRMTPAGRPPSIPPPALTPIIRALPVSRPAHPSSI